MKKLWKKVWKIVIDNGYLITSRINGGIKSGGGRVISDGIGRGIVIGSTRVSNDESVNYGYGKFMTTEKKPTQ